MEQRIRFCKTSDGISIAYAEHGAGPTLVKAANWLTHLEYDWESPVWRHWIRFFSEQFSFVRYDERGCGLSDWNEVQRLPGQDSTADALLPGAFARLSAREREVLDLIAQGLDNAQLAASMGKLHDYLGV